MAGQGLARLGLARQGRAWFFFWSMDMASLTDMERLGIIHDANETRIICVCGLVVLIVVAVVFAALLFA